MSLSTEVVDTLLNGVYLSVSTGDLVTGYPLHGTDGSLAAPTYTFASDLTAGVWRDAGVVISTDTTFGAAGYAFSNVAFGLPPSDFGGGRGVVFVSETAQIPTGALNSGGALLYVTGADIVFHDYLGNTIVLTTTVTGDVNGPTSVTASNLVKFGTASGKHIRDSGVTVSASTITTGNGTAASPAYAFSGDASTGLYLTTTGSIGVATTGTKTVDVGASSIVLTAPVSGPDGSAALPAFAFANDLDTGLFTDTASIGMSVGGAVAMFTGGVASNNIAVAGAANTGYGTSANGVVKIPVATTVPVGVPNSGSGGILYAAAAGAELHWVDEAGTDTDLVNHIALSGPSPDTSMLVWGDAIGRFVTGRAVITDAGAILGVQGGTLTNPVYSFTGDLTTGVTYVTTEHLRMVAATTTVMDMTATSCTLNTPALFTTTGGTLAIQFAGDATVGVTSGSGTFLNFESGGDACIVLNQTGNVALGIPSGADDYGNGEGVLGLVHTTAVAPTSAPVGGGFIYATSTDVLFRGIDNVEVSLTAGTGLVGPATATTSAVVRFDGTGGSLVKDSTVFCTDGGQLQVTTGYACTSGATTQFSSPSAATLTFDIAGTTGLTITPATFTAANVLASPTFYFTNYTQTGVSIAAPRVDLDVNAKTGLSALQNNNVGVGGTTFTGAGAGVVALGDVVTAPTGTLTGGGGMLYLDQDRLYFHGSTGVTTQLNTLNRVGTATDNALAVFADATGSTLLNTTVILSDTGEMSLPGGSGASPAFKVTTGVAGGMWFDDTTYPANSILYVGQAGGSVNFTDSLGLEFESTSAPSLRIGGAAGVTTTFSTPIVIHNINDANGVFRWTENGATVMQTSITGDLDVISGIKLLGGTGDCTIGNVASEWVTNVVNAADTFAIRVDGTDVLSYDSSRDVSVSNFTVATSTLALVDATFVWGFLDADPTTGLKQAWFQLNGLRALIVAGSGKSGLFHGAVAQGPLTLRNVTTVPTSLPTTGAYVYSQNSEQIRCVNKDVDVAINGPTVFIRMTATMPTVDRTLTDVGVTGYTVIQSQLVPTTSGTGFTVPYSGMWLFLFHGEWAEDSGGTSTYRRVRILPDTDLDAIEIHNSTTTGTYGIMCTKVAYLDAGVVISTAVTHRASVNIDCDVSLEAVFLG